MLTLFTRLWTERLTRVGQYIVLGAAATGIAGAFPGEMVGSYAFSFFAAFIGLSFSIALLRRPGVTVERSIPDRCMAGMSVPLTIRVANESDRSAADVGAYEFRLPPGLRITPEPQYIDRLPPGRSHTFEYAVRPERRGVYILPGPTALSAFPFALTNARRFAPQRRRLVVYPAFHPLAELGLPEERGDRSGESTPNHRMGDSMEFAGIREYRPGDRVRDLHPRSWARVGEPVVKQYAEEFRTRATLLVDTHTPHRWTVRGSGWETEFVAGADHEALEANLSLAAAVADHLARRSYLVDRLVIGPRIHRLSADRSPVRVEPILDLLAAAERSADDPLETAGPEFFHRQLAPASAVVALLLGWDDPRARLVESLRQAGVYVKPIVVTDHRPTADAARAAGAVPLGVREIRRGVERL